MTIDYERRVHRVELTDGSQHEEPLSEGIAERAGGIRRVSFGVTERKLMVTLPAGDDVVLEIGAAGERDLPPAERPVVYLDQNHWVLLSQELWAPGKVGRLDDRRAAATMIALATAEAIILPLASAHLTEAPAASPRRRHLVTTMLRLSRGWQMRSPLELRMRELRAAMGGEQSAAQDVFSLEPGALFAAPPSAAAQAPNDFALGAQELHRKLTGVSAFCAAAIQDEPERSAEARKLAQTWAASHQRLARFMGQRRMGPEHARLNARACIIADLEQELAGVATEMNLDQDRFSAWLGDTFEHELAQMPYLGRLYELVYRRLRNAQKPWEINDLNDMQFLSCAAGYAELVVAEKRTTHDLQQVERRVATGAVVCNSLPAAVRHLATLIPAIQPAQAYDRPSSHASGQA